MPTYALDAFSPKNVTTAELVQVTCQAEAVHEVIMVLSFLPVAATFLFGEFWAFLLTSLGGYLLDSVFVVLQRYNRPRLIRLMSVQGK